MFTWFKNLFGKKPETLVLTNPIKHNDKVKVTKRPPAPKSTKLKPQAKKPTTKKESKTNSKTSKAQKTK